MKPQTKVKKLERRSSLVKGTNCYHETEFGFLPEDWPLVRIGEFFQISGGGTPSTKKNEYWNGNVPWLTPTDVTSSNSLKISKSSRYITKTGLNKSSAKLMPPNSILMTSRATIGDVVINEIPMSTNQGFINIYPHENVNSEFLVYWIIKNKNYITSLASGTTFKEISKGIFKTIDIPLPSLSEQEKISNVLSTILDSIEKTNAVIEATKSLKGSMMKYLFTYGPVPVDEADKIPLKETEIGLVPEDWEVVKIGDFAKVMGGYAFKSHDYVTKGIRLLKIANVSFGKVVWDEISFLPLEYSEEYKKYLLNSSH